MLIVLVFSHSIIIYFIEKNIILTRKKEDNILPLILFVKYGINRKNVKVRHKSLNNVFRPINGYRKSSKTYTK
jgi:hypothetical protein